MTVRNFQDLTKIKIQRHPVVMFYLCKTKEKSNKAGLARKSCYWRPRQELIKDTSIAKRAALLLKVNFGWMLLFA